MRTPVPSETSTTSFGETVFSASASAHIAGLAANTPPSTSAFFFESTGSKYVGAAEVARATTDSGKSSSGDCLASVVLKKYGPGSAVS